MRMKNLWVALTLGACVGASGCSGVRSSEGTFVAHAESFRILGFAIPHDDQQAAYKLVPKGADIESVDATPADWSSVSGILGNLFWFNATRIGGTLKDD